ncbi:MAG: metallopeptidase family protein [Acidimicrobiaceae bacterium]|nr:metallopeptidase family protein [Acidimicrobiaceae bacterium]MCY4279487.1 metallopeptidase family protein [Acidimicrobiaceae bacterium]MCY4294295.1 metallopeptidase family protein [Acidimicrobiaceae bacterium]
MGLVFMVDTAHFERLVAEALDSLPPSLGEMMANIAVVVQDNHPTEELLGLYEGIPLTERHDYGGLTMPDRVTVYRMPICEICDNEDELRHEVTVTVVHEVAHHFGIDDETLHQLGWG